MNPGAQVVDFYKGEVLYLPFRHGPRATAIEVTFGKLVAGRIGVIHADGTRAVVPLHLVFKDEVEAIEYAAKRNY